jgi:DNA-binding transcriptional MocR family regulator
MIPLASRKPKPSPLARYGEVALYRQIYEHFRRAIVDGQLAPGDRLPSSRGLAEQFATARGTVDAAYAMLAGEAMWSAAVPLAPPSRPIFPLLHSSGLHRGHARRRERKGSRPARQGRFRWDFPHWTRFRASSGLI